MKEKHSRPALPSGMDGSRSVVDDAQSQSRNAAELHGWSPDLPASSTRLQTRFLHSVRTVTPEPLFDRDGHDQGTGSDGSSYVPDPKSTHHSPRSIPGGEKPSHRRQGVVFRDTFESSDSTPSNSPIFPQPRPRTRTIDDTQRPRISSNTLKTRQRVGSVHSATAPSSYRDLDTSIALAVKSVPRSLADVTPALYPGSSPPPPRSEHIKERRISSRRLVKRLSRPPSPVNAVAPPTIDALRAPVATPDATYTLQLMKRLSGKMRGLVEYQTSAFGAWCTGVCHIDDNMGNLVQESEDGPFLTVIVPDLRGCQVRPRFSTEKQTKCLEITTFNSTAEVRLIPLSADDVDLWLAALLGWQQLRPSSSGHSKPESTLSDKRPPVSRRESTFRGKDSRIIKVGRVLVWDKGIPVSPADSVSRPSTREPYSGRAWRPVSCTLQANGEFKLMTENDSSLISVVQLPQLSRRAIQRVNYSVLDEQFCIGIFPRYTQSATNLTILRPIYIAVETRVLFEVWYALLRLFAAPDLHGMDHPLEPLLENTRLDDEAFDSDQDQSIEITPVPHIDMFRVEKSIKLRIIEAKIRSAAQRLDARPTGSDPAVSDYFAEVILDGELRARTMVKYGTKNPFWREDCEIHDLPIALPTVYVILKKLEPFNDTFPTSFRSSASVNTNEGFAEVVCGIVEIRLDSLDKGKDVESWWSIHDGNQEVVGEMLMKIRHDELGVLMTKDYQRLSDMLHKFSTGLTEQVAHSVPTKLQRFAELFINIFQVSGRATEWLNVLVEDEIDGLGKETPDNRLRFNTRIGSNDSYESVRDKDRFQTVRDMGRSLAGEANLLFRGNSLLTQALDFHMRRLGQDYLEEVLQERINEINDTNPDCEVDPSRVGPGDDLTKNWTLLINLTTGVWESISQSAHKCHAELRQILKYIQAVADDRYGDFLRTVSYTSVTGFLFLRFFCPAILNPKLFGLLRDHPQPRAQRTFTLIAKALQALANLTTFGQKEEWMTPMNRFLATNRQGLKDFINEICAIPTDNPFALPPSYSTPKQILSRLPAVAREGFPSLPYLIDYSRNFAALIKLWLENTSFNDHNDTTAPGDLKLFHQECVSLQHRTDQCLRAMEQQPQPFETDSLDWDDLVPPEPSRLSMYSPLTSPEMTPTMPTMASFQRPQPPSLMTPKIPPGSAGSDSVPSTASREKRERQGFWEQTFGKESKYQRPYEAESLSSPVRGSSRNGKNKSFLHGLRRKGGSGTESPNEGSVKEDENITSPGGMI